MISNAEAISLLHAIESGSEPELTRAKRIATTLVETTQAPSRTIVLAYQSIVTVVVDITNSRVQSVITGEVDLASGHTVSVGAHSSAEIEQALVVASEHLT